MDSQIYCLIFNNGENKFFAHKYFLQKFGYFDQVFSGELELQNPFYIDVYVDFQNNKHFDNKIIQLALDIAYERQLDYNLTTIESYEIMMFMDFLQYNNMIDVERIILKYYDKKEFINPNIMNLYNNCSTNQIKKKLLELCIDDKFKTQLFHYGYFMMKFVVARNTSNDYYIDYITVNDEKYQQTNLYTAGQWLKLIISNILNIFNIEIYKYDFDFKILNNKIYLNSINVNDYLLDFVVNTEFIHKDRVAFCLQTNLNSFVKNIIIDYYKC